MLVVDFGATFMIATVRDSAGTPRSVQEPVELPAQRRVLTNTRSGNARD
jgi:hypothetical protein